MRPKELIELVKTCDKETLYTIRRESQKRIDEMNRSQNVVNKQPTPWALDMAHTLAEAAKRNFKFVKPVSLTDWAFEIDKLNKIDKQETTEIETVLKWSQTDEFWKRQVRSGRALRKHFEKLIIGMSKPVEGPAGYTCPKHNNFVPKGKVCGYC